MQRLPVAAGDEIAADAGRRSSRRRGLVRSRDSFDATAIVGLPRVLQSRLWSIEQTGFFQCTSAWKSSGRDLWRGQQASHSNLQHNFGGRTATSENTETAILAGGCFWPAQELLRHRNGVISTRVGYTGGENDNPTAGNHPGHAEAVEVIFDPERTSYRDILGC
jgi:Peptide methionine sulfoxide reductase